MGKKTTRPFLPQGENEEWRSRPGSPPMDNTTESQAETETFVQPLGGFGQDKRTTLPPADFEKTLDSALGSRPDTPAESTTSFLSRSSTLNSSISTLSKESDDTLYSHITPLQEYIHPASRSRTFPTAMGSNPVDNKSLAKGTNRLVLISGSSLERPVTFTYPTAFTVPKGQDFHDQTTNDVTCVALGRKIPPHHSQVPPARNHTFPVERPGNPERFACAQPFMNDGSTPSPVLSPSDLDGSVDPLQQQALPSSTGTAFDSWSTHEKSLRPATYYGQFYAHTEMFAQQSPVASHHATFRSFNCDPTAFQPQPASMPLSSFRLQQRKKASLNRSLSKACIGPDRVIHSASVSEHPAKPEDRSREEIRIQRVEEPDSCSPTPSHPKDPWSDSDDSAGFQDERPSISCEENEELAYDKLVASIKNLILESSCVDNLEDRSVPIERYVHGCLEKILNHPMPSAASQTLCLPIRIPHAESNKAPCDADGSDQHSRGQSSNGGSNGRNKRKSNGAPDTSCNRSGEDEGEFGDTQDENHVKDRQEAKKLKTGKKDENLSCPFRKRNPIRFNVRAHELCALSSFASLALLKRHIKNFHQKVNSSSSCLRCKERFKSQDALSQHMMQREACEPRNADDGEDPEDGITQETLQSLVARGNDEKVDSWESIWMLLFHHDDDNSIPRSDYEPPVELDEVQEYCYNERAVRKFIQSKTVNGEFVSTEGHGFHYIVETFQHSRSTQSHHRSEERNARNERFLKVVNDAFSAIQRQGYAQPVSPVVVCDPPHEEMPGSWGPSHDDPMAYQVVPGSILDVYNPAFGLDSQFSVDPGLLNSFNPQPPAQHSESFLSPEHLPRQAAPQRAPTDYTYTNMLFQNAEGPCLTGPGGSGQASSGPSSQTQDSGYQTQPDAAYLSNRRASCGGGSDDNCSTPLGGSHGPYTPPPGQSSDFHLRGVGSKPPMGPESLQRSKSDEDLGPVPNMQ
ncbi:hypothetical protein diail_9052 [Diaporthe ilicicola]|nr:hypothetical protein diail_9052 [Diaporthe ilicicola]